MTATVPESGYEEVGTIDRGTSGGGARSPATFKGYVADQVCKAGGDMVVTQISADGYIVRGAVLRKVAAP